MIIHADGTEEPASQPIDDPLINPNRSVIRVAAGSRSSARALQSSGALNAPMNEPRVTPEPSTSTVIGAASIW